MLQTAQNNALPSFLGAYAGSTIEFVRVIAKQRRLLGALARRDISEDYVDHGFSLVWTVIQPLFTMAVYVFCFVYIFPTRVDPPDGFPTNAVIYLLSGITPWMVICQVMNKGLGSIIGHAGVVKQMAFPLELLPTKSLASPLLFAAVAISFLTAATVYAVGAKAVLVLAWALPLLVLISLVLFTGLSLTLASLQVFLRDTKEFVSMFTTIGFFLHPILYLPNAIPDVVRPVLYLSPLTYFIMCWQDIFFYGGIVRPSAWLITTAFALVLLVFGARLFMGSNAHFGDFL